MTVPPSGVRSIRARHDLTTTRRRLKARAAKMAQERLIPTESRPAALGKADKAAKGGFESGCPGCCGARDTFHVGTLKGVGRVRRQTFIGTCAEAGFAKLYDRKAPITAADLPDGRVVPFRDGQDAPPLRIPTDRGTECCGRHGRHEHELDPAVGNIGHGRTRTKSPQTNGIVERFAKTILDEFHRAAFRRKSHTAIEEPRADLDLWMAECNQARSHRGRCCFGKPPMRTFIDAAPAARGKACAARAPVADATA
jgi:hypothetical protein